MSATLKIYCKNIGEYIPIKGGETLGELAAMLAPRLGGMRPVCAHVNNKTEPMQYQVFGPKQVEFLSVGSRSGQRVYVRSLCMMLYCAVAHEYPGLRLRIEHSISGGYYCRLFEGRVNLPADRMPEVVMRLKEAMRSLVSRNVPFERKERLTDD